MALPQEFVNFAAPKKVKRLKSKEPRNQELE